MTSTNFDTYLTIRNQQLQLLAEDDDSFDDTLGSTNSRIAYYLPTDGKYFIEATSAIGGQTGSYKIGFDCPPPPPWSGQITLTSPSDGSLFTDVPADVLVRSTVSLPGSVDRVEYYTNFTLLTTVSNAPYDYDWSGVPAGSYTLTAVAFGLDALGVMMSVTSAPVTVNVASPPWSGQITLTSPSDGALYPDVPPDISIQSSVSLSGCIDRVEYYTNFTLLTTVPNAPYDYDWIGVPAGNYTLTAIAFGPDASGAMMSVTSAPATVYVGSPASYVTILTPTNKSSFSTVPADVAIEASAFIPNGVYEMDFYTNGNLLASIDQSGATFGGVWDGVPSGNYYLIAVASGYDIDWNWISITSAPVNISVIETPLPSIVLNPVTECAKLLTGSDATTATLYDASSNLITGNITFTVIGANPTNYTVATSDAGVASFVYTGTNAGCDMIIATATVGGLQTSAVAERDWAQPVSCDQIWFGTLTNTSCTSSRSGYADYYSFTG
jgi:hypothetical protein